jgi:hypothetical protein
MTLKVKMAYLEAVRQRYFNSSKKNKTKIDELCQVTGYSRKYAIKILAIGHKLGPKSLGRKRFYSAESIKHLKKLWHIIWAHSNGVWSSFCSQ